MDETILFSTTITAVGPGGVFQSDYFTEGPDTAYARQDAENLFIGEYPDAEIIRADVFAE